MPFSRPSVRLKRLGEAVRILRDGFTAEKFSFADKHSTPTDLVIKPRPVRLTGIPIVLGGGGRKMLSLVSRMTGR